MKGTPETPQCGFSRATVQILGMQGVDPGKFVAFNVLEDQDLRDGEFIAISHKSVPYQDVWDHKGTNSPAL